jgi:hypothetical protein
MDCAVNMELEVILLRLTMCKLHLVANSVIPNQLHLPLMVE